MGTQNKANSAGEESKHVDRYPPAYRKELRSVGVVLRWSLCYRVSEESVPWWKRSTAAWRL